MKAFSFKEPWVKTYVERLLRSSASTKKAIIRILERSMEPQQGPPQENEQDRKKRLETFWSSFGAWEGDGTAEELAASIRNARVDTPDREPL